MSDADKEGSSADPIPPGPKKRISWIGFVALGVSIAATLGLYLFIFASSGPSWTQWADTLPEGPRDFYDIFTLNFLLFSGPIAIVIDIVAGFFGRGNRRAGLIGGLLLISPLMFVLAVFGINMLQHH
jgi:hypothetical protein